VLGAAAQVVLVVEADDETHVRGVWLALAGRRWSDEAVVEFMRDEECLLPETYLRAGVTRLPRQVHLSPTLPPTLTRGTGIEYRFEARVGVPFWFDAREIRDVRVALPAAVDARPPPHPAKAVSEAIGEGVLFAELNLDDTLFAPGESITGSFSVGNVREEQLLGATLTVVGTAPLGAGLDATVFKSLVGAREATTTRFAVPIPHDTVPDFRSSEGEVARALVLAFDGSAATCRIPIRIGAFAANERPPSRGAAKEISAGPRWRAAWREAGARVGLSMHRRELRLEGTVAGEVTVSVRARGAGLAARLAWEDLGIGLSLAPRGLTFRGVDLYAVDPEMSDRYTVLGRSEIQVRDAFEADLCAAVLAFDRATLDDHGAEVRSHAHARDQRALATFLDAVVMLATTIVRAEARLSPPPWAYELAPERWRAFADTTGARFRRGRMAIHDATLDGDRFDVDTLVDAGGDPDRTRVTLAIDPPAPRELSDDARRALLQAIRPRDPGARLSARADALAIELAGFQEDPAKLRDVYAALQRAARRLRGEPERGPYR
jgi:hypothetical protein